MRADTRGLLRRTMAVILAAGFFMSLCLTASASTPTEAPVETPAAPPTETPVETPTETPAAPPTETPVETPTATPTETPAATLTATPTATPAATPTEAPVETPAAKARDGDEETLPVYIDGLLYARARIESGTVFISPDCVCRFLGLDMDWEADDKTMSLTVGGAELSGEAGRLYMTVSGRYLYEPEGWLVRDGELYLPADAVQRLLNLELREMDKPHRIEISTAKAAVITGGEEYYELSYPVADLFWLGQVIYSESYQQPLAGQIGVGNVVMNRVACKDFPDSIFDVVFDVEGVVQFEPVSTGGIYVTPDEQSLIAARLCLEGYNTVGDSLYFVNPSKGSYWFDNTLELVIAIGEHNFYR